MSPRKIETALAYFTLAVLLGYAPAETIFSWARGLGDPYYIVDLIAMALLLLGAVHSLRRRPQSAAGLLTVGWAWAGANFWRALFDRVSLLSTGESLRWGALEYRFAIGATVVALLCVGTGVLLQLRSARTGA
jgi:hypothetical protein